jgi:16S rRNA (adenine1518-N6/adenine1519-N6)-dimethyltransferase
MSAPHRAKKSLGQNFLLDPNQQRRIVAALEAAPHDVVLEIGPGQGALTRHLAGTVRRLILVELDDHLAAALAMSYGGRPDVAIVHADFMDVDLTSLADDVRSLLVVGNIPYNITTPLIFRLLERDLRPRRIVLLVQQEVADRIVARAGDHNYGALSVGVQSVARVEKLFRVARGSFRPVPGVDSTLIRIEPIEPPPLTRPEEADLRQLTRTLFTWRRKQLQKTLRSAPEYALDGATLQAVAQETGIELERRPEQLEPDALVRLARTLRRRGRPPAQESRGT